MKRCHGSCNLVELGLGSSPKPSKKFHRVLLSTSASSDQLAERLNVPMSTSTIRTYTRPKAFEHFLKPLTFQPCQRLEALSGDASVSPQSAPLPKHIITVKFPKPCEEEDKEGSTTCEHLTCVPAWVAPLAYDELQMGFGRTISGNGCPGTFRGTSTKTTAATSLSGSYIGEDEQRDCENHCCTDQGRGATKSLSKAREADMFNDLIKEMQRLYNAQEGQSKILSI